MVPRPKKSPVFMKSSSFLLNRFHFSSELSLDMCLKLLSTIELPHCLFPTHTNQKLKRLGDFLGDFFKFKGFGGFEFSQNKILYRFFSHRLFHFPLPRVF